MSDEHLIKIPAIEGIQTVGLFDLNQNISKYFRMANQDRIATRVTLYKKLYAVIIPGPKIETDAVKKAWHKKHLRRKRTPQPEPDAGHSDSLPRL